VSKECEAGSGLDECVTFDTNTYEQILNWGSGISTNRTGYGIFPLYRRGYFFNGEDTMRVNGLTINPTFTIEIWTWPDKEGNVFSISKPIADVSAPLEETLLNIILQDTKVVFVFASSISNQIFKGISLNSYTNRNWEYLVFTAQWETDSTIIRGYLNTLEVITGTVDFPFVDNGSNFHCLGFEYNYIKIADDPEEVWDLVTQSHFNGFIYKVCWRDTTDSPNQDSTSNIPGTADNCEDNGHCLTCPKLPPVDDVVNPDCLISCNHD
jgi:hypothetical protein